MQVEDIVGDVVRLFSAKIRNRSVVVTQEVSGELRLFGIVSQIRQLMAHLLSNAIDAVPVGGTVLLRAQQQGDRVELSVQDYGAGIPEADQKRLFQPFFSTKGDLGNGLGLYISREIAERHAGTVEIESTGGVGTTARVLLPAEPAFS